MVAGYEWHVCVAPAGATHSVQHLPHMRWLLSILGLLRSTPPKVVHDAACSHVTIF